MLDPLRRSAALKTTREPLRAANNSLADSQETLRNINWKLIVFCVALWWFIYSAPTEGILSPHFWAASNATSSDDF